MMSGEWGERARFVIEIGKAQVTSGRKRERRETDDVGSHLPRPGRRVPLERLRDHQAATEGVRGAGLSDKASRPARHQGRDP